MNRVIADAIIIVVIGAWIVSKLCNTMVSR
nr:MAG TPA: hypothetical protein [Caudoviricetes sp.]